MGLSFISQRLELMSMEWNGDYFLKIQDKRNDSGIPSGTTVTITIPILNNNDVKSSNY